MQTVITSAPFGRLSGGHAASLYTLRNARGAAVQFTDFGVALVSAHMPDREGVIGPVVLGFDTLGPYEDNPAYIGTVIGPVASRIGNAAYSLDGHQHQLSANDAPSCLHSADEGWHNKLWQAEVLPQSLRFRYEANPSAGFPGRVKAQIEVSFDAQCRLTFALSAQTDKPTPIAMTRHDYFNLTDGGASPIHDHIIELKSRECAQLDSDKAATGALVENAAFEHPQTLNQFITGDGLLSFDTHFIVPGAGLRHMARVQSPRSGRQLDVLASMDGLQFYTGQFLPKCRGAAGVYYGPCHGLALEPQARPNAVNIPQFPSVILRPDERYSETIIYEFGLMDAAL